MQFFVPHPLLRSNFQFKSQPITVFWPPDVQSNNILYGEQARAQHNLPLKIIHCEKDWNLRDEFDEPTSIYDENRSSLITLFSQFSSQMPNS